MPRKLGQHFLHDLKFAARLVKAADISSGDHVAEVGPGRGALTNLIVQARPSMLTLIEVDSELVGGLRAKYADQRWVSVMEADARTLDPVGLPEGPAGRDYKLVGNLPYYAAAPIIRNFLESGRAPTIAVVMIQKEVATEMAATPGSMGLLSIGVQVFAEVEVLFDVPPSAFRPPPRVTSSVVRLKVLPAPRTGDVSTREFFGVVRAGFRAPRKVMANSLALGLGIGGDEARRALELSGIDPGRRPATLSITEWVTLCATRRDSRSAAGADGK